LGMEPMSREKYRIKSFRALGACRIQIQYSGGEWIEVDLSDLVAVGNLLAQLADDQYLAQGKIGEGAHFIEWPGELDIHADSLWARGVPIEDPAILRR